jgi:hypothetical protein
MHAVILCILCMIVDVAYYVYYDRANFYCEVPCIEVLAKKIMGIPGA